MIFENEKEQQQDAVSFPFMPENADEAACQLLLQRRLSDVMGGALPPALDLSGVHSVLDVGCGAGGWIFELGLRYPAMQIVGIDRSAYFIEQASILLKHMNNITLLIEDMFALEKIFDPASFDLVHLRFLAGEVPFQRFPTLIHSLTRLCHPGGFFTWTEAELPITNSPACDLFESLLLCALQVAGRAFSPGYSLQLNIFPWMEAWLRYTFHRLIQDNLYEIDISTGAKAHSALTQQARVFGQQVRPFLLETGVVTATEIEDVYAHMQREMQAEGFRGTCPVRAIVCSSLR